ncbi:unnamed protein product [Chironomus riparius]|uniref:Uncharacterized protein n=1 Tax=Chironomus riparius TaxID=315576 RepID=A0A9N9RJY6_9DIPT|nr:unnamed protein product [Chironomus riparius]
MEVKDMDVVISGMSGRFPNSNNVKEFEYNLFNKIDMTDDDTSRWNHFQDEVPHRFGKIRNLEKFDASFFSTLNKHANWTDPQIRILLEHSYEAILDAGVSPQSLVGTRTGVFMGCSVSDARDVFTHKLPPKDGYVLVGNSGFYIANRISYALGLCGPSLTIDTACSSSAYALDCAFRYMEAGLCDTALVGGSQLILNSRTAIEYSRLGLLAKDGISRPYDVDASGFVRAETICVLLLQRRKDSKRIYANVVYSSSNNDGFKEEGHTFPSRVMHQQLMEHFYKNINFDPSNVNFVEAHATSTKLGDPEELAAIDKVFNKSSERSKILTVGSVKSNMGHAEAASAMSSLTKVLLSFENHKFPPNIHLKALRSDIPAFAEGRIRVATEVEDLHGEFIAMNSFGLGGGNAHSLFRGNPKVKINSGIPKDNLGRMVLWSGRTEAAINAIIDDITQRPLDAEHIALLQSSQVQTTIANTYRGYGMFIKGESGMNAVCTKKNIEYFDGSRRPIVFVYSGIGSQWLEMGRDLMIIPLFAQSIENCHNILMTKGIDLKHIITSTDEKTFSNVLHSYVGIVAIEIALTDILRELKIVPDYIIGHSVGELGCAYADNCLTAEETILAAYARGEASNESETIKGAMAAVGMNYSKLKAIIPEDIDIACHNAEDSCTISGPIDSVNAFVNKLKEDKVFAKEVSSSGVPLHSRYIKDMGHSLSKKLKDIIKDPKVRSEKWLSSTYSKDLWNQTNAMVSSAEYHTKNLLNPVLFQEVTEMLPNDALTIEVAPSGLLRAILKRSLKEGAYVNITERNSKDGFNRFLEALGSIFQHGVDLDISRIYPSVSFPVSRGTPIISHTIKWNHEDSHFVPYFDSYNTFERHNMLINISDKKFEVVQNHIVDGRVLFPATGWIFLVWETFSKMIGAHYESVKVILEDLHLLRATTLEKNQDILVTISIHRATGRFEVIEGNAPVARGVIKQAENIKMSEISPPDDSQSALTTDDFYQEVRLSGIILLGLFQGVTEMSNDNLKGKIRWSNNWITFMDTIIHFHNKRVLFSREVAVPVRIRKFIIDPILHYKMVGEKIKQFKAANPDRDEMDITFDVAACPHQQIINAGAVEVHEKIYSRIQRRLKHQPQLEINKFVPYFTEEVMSLDDAAKLIIQMLIDKTSRTKVVIVEKDNEADDEKLLFSEYIQKAIGGIPQLVGDMTLLTSKSNLNIKDVTIGTDDITSMSGIDLLIEDKCFGDQNKIQEFKSVMNINGYIVSRETQCFSDIPHEDVQLVARIRTASDKILHILQFTDDSMQHKTFSIIEITSNVSDWLEPLKASLKESLTIIYAYNQEPSGILGFIKTLKLEYQGKIRCFFIMDTENAPSDFDINDDFFKKQLKLNDTINIFKDGKWGGYRHLNIVQINNSIPQTSHCFADCLIKGDLSSLTWMQGSYDIHDPKLDLVNIQCSSLNFKDVMLALGRITSYKPGKVIEEVANLGFEFSGTKRNGERVMGIANSPGALATHYDAKNAMLWNVPDSWTLEEAATVPLVYFTVYFAFFHTTTIKAGKKILIHSGTGGVGQAAIEVAFAYGLEVFTTVSTEDKKNFLLKKFPKLKSENIGNSRDTSFEKMVIKNTNGKGVDYVLNSLAGEKLQASIRCLGVDGVFLEIGKYDIQSGTNLDMGYLGKRITLKSVIFDDLALDPNDMQFVYSLVDKDLKSGIIKPLNVTVFDANKIEDAFRYMTTGYHIGKVVLKMRQNENDKCSLPLNSLNRVYYNSDECIIIPGGLGGFGIELAEWLVLRGCRKLILSSRRGISTGRQAYKIALWESLGAKVVVSTANTATEEGCDELIKQAIELGPVGAIYNLAGVIRDKLFEDIDETAFNETLAPKALATKHLDKISRVLCPNLKHFVVFSSVACGRGNIGQSNYSMANSVMERIIEERHRDGLPGKAIQWGAIGDVGMLAEAQLKDIGKDFLGSIPQPILSCFEVLDTLLTSDDPIVSSMIVADKKSSNSKKRNIIDIIFNIMGIRDRKSVSMDSSLTQLGIDSLTGVELQQTIEREFDISLTSQELRSLTLNQLSSRVTSKSIKSLEIDEEVSTTERWMTIMMEGVIDNNANLITSETIVKANDVENKSNTKVLIIPGLIGYAANVFRNLAKQLDFPAYILQLIHTTDCKSIDDIIKNIIDHVLNLFSDAEHFILIGHSFGTILTLKLAKVLEDCGKSGQVIQLDGSPEFLKKYTIQSIREGNLPKFNNHISMILFNIFQQFVDSKISKSAIENHKTWESRLKAMIAASGNKIPASYEQLSDQVCVSYTNRLNITRDLKNEEFSILKATKISLIKASKPPVAGFIDDYGLSVFSTSSIVTNTVFGDHTTFLQNPELSTIVKKLISN